MSKQGLIIGIDYTNEYCQACYYSTKHGRPESISDGTEVMRYLIPAVLSFNADINTWLIGSAALEYAHSTGAGLYRDLLDNMMADQSVAIGDKLCTYEELFSIYLGKLLDQVRVRSAVMNIDSITVNLRAVSLQIKQSMENVFRRVNIEPDKLKFISCAESFAYYLINEPEELWLDGAILFDFSEDGFFTRQLSIAGEMDRRLVYINERSYPMDFSMRDLASEMLRDQLDERLNNIYEDLKSEGRRSSVFFTGEGFNELWFRNTLKNISSRRRAFKGNNIYVKGACLAGLMRAEGKDQDLHIVCQGRTKADIYVEVRYQGQPVNMNLSKSCIDWYDAYSDLDFILGDEKSITFSICSLVSRETTQVVFDLSGFPERPPKTTRVGISVRYINDSECEITVRDKGFGAFWPASGEAVTKRLNLEGYN
ncbi:MAG: hypothetical protein IKH67_07630 [Lachnospiraceae bacterium]|nr:hypothetical protein [Lachnospiraceae bacterium]